MNTRNLTKFALAAVAALLATNASAALVLDVSGVLGSGVTTWSLSGSSTVNQDGTIRTSAGSASFSIDDTFEPDVSGNFLSNSALQNQLFVVSGAASITVGSDTQTITHIFLDEDGSSRDDFGIRTDAALSYATGEASSWVGSFTVALDIGDFFPGSYRLNTTQANGGGFLFAGVDDVILNFAVDEGRTPAPAAVALLGLGLAGLGLARRRRR